MEELKKTEDSRVVRNPSRGCYERETIHQIIDEALHCQVGFIDNGKPVVIPMVHWRKGNNLYLHAARSARITKQLLAGPTCISLTLVDGLVLARSAFHHSMNYRSVTLFAQGESIEDVEEKAALLDHFVAKLFPERNHEVRPADDKELKATAVLAFPIENASAKIRQGGPKDDAADMDLPVWAGVIPVTRQFGEPIVDPEHRNEKPFPEALKQHFNL